MSLVSPSLARGALDRWLIWVRVRLRKLGMYSIMQSISQASDHPGSSLESETHEQGTLNRSQVSGPKLVFARRSEPLITSGREGKLASKPRRL